jgi:hypothetical protein
MFYEFFCHGKEWDENPKGSIGPFKPRLFFVTHACLCWATQQKTKRFLYAVRA